MNDLKNKLLKSKRTVIFLHFIFWAAFFLFPLLNQYPQGVAHNPFGQPQNSDEFNRNPFKFYDLFLLVYFYLNAYLIYPKLFQKKKITFFTIQIFCFLAYLLFLYILNHYILERPNGPRVIFFPFFIFFISSTAFRVVTDKINEDNIRKEKENEHLKTELAFLRSQISPHFIFNVLNNTVSLARMKSDLVEPTLIKLSNIMRYMIYESDTEKVSVEKEIEYIQSYVDLQKLRFQDDVKIEFTVKGDFSVRGIEPMLLIPFVENAFKHGIGLIENPEINISFTENEGVLIFHVKNKYKETLGDQKDTASGIGLKNIQRRLELLYADNFTLNIDKTEDWFSATLTLREEQ